MQRFSLPAHLQDDAENRILSLPIPFNSSLHNPIYFRVTRSLSQMVDLVRVYGLLNTAWLSEESTELLKILNFRSEKENQETCHPFFILGNDQKLVSQIR